MPAQNKPSQLLLRDLFQAVAICAVVLSLAKLNQTRPSTTLLAAGCALISFYCLRTAILEKWDFAALILSLIFLLWGIVLIAIN